MIDESILRERLMATLRVFRIAGVVARCIGLYGILSYGPSRNRTNEIGIRMALGAQGRDVRWLILREAVWLVLEGRRRIADVVLQPAGLDSLYGLKAMIGIPWSRGAFSAVCVAMGAGYIPARRATRVDPLVALRYE